MADSQQQDSKVNGASRGMKTQQKTTSPGPPATQPESYFFFYHKSSPFSQHHPSNFQIDGVNFNCAEQYMMYSKAVLFKDDTMKKKIMATDDPVKQKKYGRQVQNFEKDVWDIEAEKAVKRASVAKFEQNEDLRKQLLATHPHILVEASPQDRIWGIGLGASNPKALNKANWRGKNKLGYILTSVREDLIKETE